MDHDQSFKNLILDYPREALAFLAPALAATLPADAVITPIREEQLKERLDDRFHELDVPLLVEFPSGKRAAIVLDIEEQTEPAAFRIHSLAHYALKLAAAFNTDRVVPIVVVLRPGRLRRELVLGVDGEVFLHFRFLVCQLSQLRAADYADSDNLVARLNLANMAHPPEARLDLYTRSLAGLLALEPDAERRRKYRDFVDQYARLTEAERIEWKARQQKEASVGWWSEERREEIARSSAEAMAKGKAEGKAEGEAKGKAEQVLKLARQGLLSAAAARHALDSLVLDGEVTPAFAEEIRRQLPDAH